MPNCALPNREKISGDERRNKDAKRKLRTWVKRYVDLAANYPVSATGEDNEQRRDQVASMAREILMARDHGRLRSLASKWDDASWSAGYVREQLVEAVAICDCLLGEELRYELPKGFEVDGQ